MWSDGRIDGRTDRLTDRHDEANCRFPQFCERTSKKKKNYYEPPVDFTKIISKKLETSQVNLT